MGNITSEVKSPHVPGQFLGFSLQVTRISCRLLTAQPNSFVSLEVFDDVGIELPGGKRVGEQDKSVTGDGNPISDRSIDFWKTFSNWVDAAINGELSPEHSEYVIYTSRHFNGGIAENFSQADSIQKAREALAKAKSELWGAHPSYPAKNKVSSNLSPYLENVFTNQEIAHEVIRNFKLEFGSGSPQNDLKTLVENSPFVPVEIVDDLVPYIQGWVKRELDILLEQKKPAIIERDKFKNEILSYVRKNDNRTILKKFACSPNDDDIAAGLLKNYIRQLEFIDCNQEQKICAINDYIFASFHRTEWSTRGIVNNESFQELEEKLKRTWQHLKTKTNIQFSEKSDVEKGMLIYLDCISHETDLQGLVIPHQFIPGNFHALADELDIGWHPDYKNFFQKLNKNDG